METKKTAKDYFSQGASHWNSLKNKKQEEFQKTLTLALTQFNFAVQEEGDNVDYLLAKACAQSFLSQYVEAIETYEKILRDEQAQKIAKYRQVIQIATHNRILDLFHVAQQKLDAKDFDGCIADMDKVIATTDKFKMSNFKHKKEAYFIKGMANLGKKDYQEAIKCFDIAIEQAKEKVLWFKVMPSSESNIELLFKKGFAHYSLGMEQYEAKNFKGAQESFKVALTAFNEALKLSSDKVSVNIWYHKALVYQLLGELKKAVEYYDKVLQHRPKQVAAAAKADETKPLLADAQQETIFDMAAENKADVVKEMGRRKQMAAGIAKSPIFDSGKKQAVEEGSSLTKKEVAGPPRQAKK